MVSEPNCYVEWTALTVEQTFIIFSAMEKMKFVGTIRSDMSKWSK